MFNNEFEIYQHIGQAMFNALPEQWDSAYFYCRFIDLKNGSCMFTEGYLLDGVDYNYDVDRIDGEYKNSHCSDAFFSLYQLMKKNKDDKPWNKARFELMPNGDFDIQFKYDEDFAWLWDLNDDKIYSQLGFENRELINSWEGVPEDYDRYWLKL